MPQGEGFWNPYRMIPVRTDAPTRSRPITHESFAGKSGTIVCQLINRTPLVIGQQSRGKTGKIISFVESQGKPVIPGSSLKGMLRSLAELIGNGCACIGRHVDRQHAKCDDPASLCIACRLFGMMKERTSYVFMGKVSISDATYNGDKPVYISADIVPGSPKPTHVSFYINPATGTNDKAVRKLYCHQPRQIDHPLPCPSDLRHRASQVKPLAAGSAFTFAVNFSNLEDDELALLVYCLGLEKNARVTIEGERRRTLEGPLYHKLGYGKPLGMGTVHVQPVKMKIRDMKARYKGGIARDNSEEIFEGEDLRARVDSLTSHYRADMSDTMQALRKMLVWDESDDREFSYPSYKWFKTAGNSARQLKRI